MRIIAVLDAVDALLFYGDDGGDDGGDSFIPLNPTKIPSSCHNNDRMSGMQTIVNQDEWVRVSTARAELFGFPVKYARLTWKNFRAMPAAASAWILSDKETKYSLVERYSLC